MGVIADISVYQGMIDWQTARERIDLAIFRASVGMSPDAMYDRNVAACGVPYGAYHYVKAGNAEDAVLEAEKFVKCASTGKPLFWIADIEHETQTETTTEAVCVAFLKRLRELGCGRIGMYINTKYNWAGAAIGMCDIMWIPHWGHNDGNIPEEGYAPKHPCDLWQYTSMGRVDGIPTVVDLSVPRDGRTLEWFINGPASGDSGKEGGGDQMLTNLMLAAYCREVHDAGWVYWYGSCGYECTQALYERKKIQYPEHYGESRTSGYRLDIAQGRMCADCVGMIKSFFWTGGNITGKNVYKSHGCDDMSADVMFSRCSERGPIAKIPDVPGLLVHKPGHIGVYVGDGYTIEMKGFAYDCVMNKVDKGPWTEWGRLPASMLVYVDAETGEAAQWTLGSRVLKRGCVGADVRELQQALMELGYALNLYGADGDYGEETTMAVRVFQRQNGLEADGIFGAASLKALREAQAGRPIEEQPLEPDTPVDGAEPAQAAESGAAEPTHELVITGTEAALRAAQSAYGGVLTRLDEIRRVGILRDLTPDEAQAMAARWPGMEVLRP